MKGEPSPWLPANGGQNIFLLRHGDIRKKTGEKRFIGQTDLPLNDSGRRQAQWWRRCLASFPLTRILSSDLSRCTETAGIIATARPLTVEPLPGLREIHLGEWDGLSFRRVREQWPEAFQKRGLDLALFRPPGGESFLDLQQRVARTFNEAVKQSGGHLLIVAHAGVNRVLLCYILGMPTENLFRIQQDCGAMNLIQLKRGRFRIQFINLRPHPDVAARTDQFDA